MFTCCESECRSSATLRLAHHYDYSYIIIYRITTDLQSISIDGKCQRSYVHERRYRSRILFRRFGGQDLSVAMYATRRCTRNHPRTRLAMAHSIALGNIFREAMKDWDSKTIAAQSCRAWRRFPERETMTVRDETTLYLIGQFVSDAMTSLPRLRNDMLVGTVLLCRGGRHACH
jgi:hypothetical protein